MSDDIIEPESGIESVVSDTDAGLLADESTDDSAPDGPGSPAAVPPEGLGVNTSFYEYRCKICRLANTNPTIYKKLHDLVLSDRRSYNSAMAEVNTYIKQHSIDLALLNMMNILKHFKKHISTSQRTALTIAQALPGPPVVPAAAGKTMAEVEKMAQSASASDVDDFNNLNDLRKRITNVVTSLQSQLEEKDPVSGQIKLNKHAVQLFAGLIAETRACINDLNKMRQSERLIKTVVQSLLDRMTFAIIPQLLEEYKLVVEELVHAGVPKEVADRCDERLRRKSAEIIAVTARAAVTEIQRQFKLR